MTVKKWELISRRDVSPHAWFPVEMRTYKLPNGQIVEDFSVTTIADVSMIVPITKDGRVVFVRQFKPGAGEVVLEFPAGRIDAHHKDFLDLAKAELEEETGIRVDDAQITQFAVLSGFTTKGTEKVHTFLARNCEFNSSQKLDLLENIDVVPVPLQEVDSMINSGEIWTAQTIAAWSVAKLKFPELVQLA